MSPPEEADSIHKEYVFKLHFKSHVYFFRAESEYTFERYESLSLTGSHGVTLSLMWSHRVHTEPERVTWGFTEPDRVQTEPDSVTWGHTEPNRVQSEPDRVTWDHTEPDRVTWVSTEPYVVTQGHIEPNRVTQGHTEPDSLSPPSPLQMDGGDPECSQLGRPYQSAGPQGPPRDKREVKSGCVWGWTPRPPWTTGD